MSLFTDAEPSDSAVTDAGSDHHTSSVSHQLGATEDRGSGNLPLSVQTSQLSREAGNDSCASADGFGSSHGPASSEPAGGSQTPDGGDQVPGSGIQMADGSDHGGSQAVESGTANSYRDVVRYNQHLSNIIETTKRVSQYFAHHLHNLTHSFSNMCLPQGSGTHSLDTL